METIIETEKKLKCGMCSKIVEVVNPLTGLCNPCDSAVKHIDYVVDINPAGVFEQINKILSKLKIY